MNHKRLFTLSALALFALLVVLGSVPTTVGATSSSYAIFNLGTGLSSRSAPIAINNAGQISPIETFIPGQFDSFFWVNGSWTLLPREVQNGYVNVFVINDAGQVAGIAFNSGNNDHAFRYDSGTITDLGNLNSPAYHESEGYGINSAGDVIGGESVPERRRGESSAKSIARSTRRNRSRRTIDERAHLPRPFQDGA